MANKLILTLAAIVALALVVSAHQQRVSYRNLLSRRDKLSGNSFYSAPLNITLQTITQRLDNFDPTNLDTWEQRFYNNNEFFQPGGPLFVFLSGEWAITEFRLTESHMATIASELDGNIFYLEHRFYGESRPTANVSTDNLRFLNPEQALADTAHFINHIQSTVEGAANSPVILVGAHYSASLAVWFRQAYPHLAVGVWASSAPLISIVDFDQFKVATGRAFRTVGGDACYDALEHGFEAMQELVDEGGLEELSERFRICDTLESEDLPHFFSLMAEIYAILPMFATEASIRGTCALLQSPAGNELDRVAAILSIVLDDEECLLIDYDYIVEADRQIDWDAVSVEAGFRQWTYTVCSQIGWFHSSGAEDQPFGNTFPVDIYYQACEDVFGETFTSQRLLSNSDRFNTIYGGLNPEVSNVVFVYGQYDPWSVLGRTTDLNEDATAIVIDGATQGNDLGLITDSDTPALRAAKLQISALIEEWITEASN